MPKDATPKTWALRPSWDGRLWSKYPNGEAPFQDYFEPGYFAEDYFGPAGTTAQVLAGAAIGTGQASGAAVRGVLLSGAAAGSAQASGAAAHGVPLAGAATGSGASSATLDPGSAGASALTSFTLTRASAGTGVPFSLGQVFKKGDIPAGVVLTCDSTSYQVLPLSTWDDGSVKHAVVAGTVTLAANTPKAVAFGRGSAPVGTALAESDLISAAPTATIVHSTAGTVSLASLLGTSALKITEHAGPVYAAFQYVADFPSDSVVRAVFYVQLWAGGSYRVRAAVEWGRPLGGTGGAGKTGAATITIAGAQVLNQSVTMLPGTRFDAEGGNFVLPTPLHDVAYLRSTKLFPNYGWTAPSAAALNALTSTYTPLGRGGWIQDMGSGGFAPHIGLLPHWDAMYLTTGDVRALNASLINGRAYGCYGVYWRDATTHRMPKPSDYPTAYSGDPAVDQMAAGGNRWEAAHQPNAGYLPWLLTAERFHLETLQANAWTAFYTQAPNGGGISRIYNAQTRQRAWNYRTAVVTAAVSPTGDPAAADYRTGAAANLAHLKTNYVDLNTPATGLLWIYDDKDPGTAGFQHSIFENLFGVATMGFAWDIEPGFNAAQKANQQAVRDFYYRVPVGLTGQGQAAGQYNWRRAPGPYRMVIGPDGSSLYGTWGEIELATWGADGLPATDGLTISESYADDQNPDAFPIGNWGHVITALSYAVDHGAPGAQAGMNRILGASNWNSNAVNFNNWPQYGVLQRIPQAFGLQAASTWKNIGTSFMSGIGPQAGISPAGIEHTSVGIFSYSGGRVINSSFFDRNGVKRTGAAIALHGGGHNAESSNEVTMFRLADQSWYRVRDGYATPTGEATANPDGTPVSVHSYGMVAWLESLNILVRANSSIIYGASGATSRRSWRFDLNNSSPNGAGPGPWAENPQFPNPGTGVEGSGIMTCYDSDNRRVIAFTPGRVNFAYFDAATLAWTMKGEGNPISYSDRGSACYVPGKQWVVVHIPPSGGGEPSGLLIADPNATTPSFTAMSTAGSPPAAGEIHGICWDARNGRVVTCDEAGVLRVATPPATIGGTWTWSVLSTSGGDTPEIETGTPAGKGIWGRFGYVDDGVLLGYVLMGGSHTRASFYKLAA